MSLHVIWRHEISTTALVPQPHFTSLDQHGDAQGPLTDERKKQCIGHIRADQRLLESAALGQSAPPAPSWLSENPVGKA